MGSLSASSYEPARNMTAFVKAARKNTGFAEFIGHPFYQETMNNLSQVMGLPVEKYVQLTIDRARRDNPDRDDWEVAQQEKQNFDGLALKFAKGELDEEPQHLYNSLQKAGDRMGNALESLISGEPQEGETAFSFGMPSENEQVSWTVPQGIKGVPDGGDPRFVRKIPGTPQYNGDPGFSIGSKSGYDFDRGFSMIPPATNGTYNQRDFVFPNIKNGMRRGLQGPVNFNSRPSKEENPFSPRLEQIIEEAVRSKTRYSGNNQNAGTVRGFQNLPFPVEQGNEHSDFRYLSDTMNGNMGINEPNVTLAANVNRNNQPKQTRKQNKRIDSNFQHAWNYASKISKKNVDDKAVSAYQHPDYGKSLNQLEKRTVKRISSKHNIPTKLAYYWKVKPGDTPKIPDELKNDKDFKEVARAYKAIFDYKVWREPNGVCESHSFHIGYFMNRLVKNKKYDFKFIALGRENDEFAGPKMKKSAVDYYHRAVQVIDKSKGNKVVAILDPFEPEHVDKDFPKVWTVNEWVNEYGKDNIYWDLPDFMETDYAERKRTMDRMLKSKK